MSVEIYTCKRDQLSPSEQAKLSQMEDRMRSEYESAMSQAKSEEEQAARHLNPFERYRNSIAA